MPNVSSKKHRRSTKSPLDQRILYLVFVLLLLLASITILQQPQDIRNRAEEVDNTPTISPTPLLRCNVPCTLNAQCPTGLVCYEESCRNPQCANQDNCVCKVSPTSKPITPTVIPPSPTHTPLPPTATPTKTLTSTLTPILSPTPIVEAVVQQEVPKASILEVVIKFLSNTVCKLVRAC